jgi:malic enzyme
MKIQAALNLAAHVKNPTAEKIIPSPFDTGVVDAIADAIQ